MKVPFLNCDLGEGEDPTLSRGLIGLVGAVNIACGGHAGDDESIRFCIREASLRNLLIGAHPGLPDGFGRSAEKPSPDLFLSLLEDQLGHFLAIAREEGVAVDHVKLHGALYHLTETDAMLRSRYLEVIQGLPGLSILALAGGQVALSAQSLGIRCYEEVFLDRNYLPTGGLVARDQPDALVSDPDILNERLTRFLDTGVMRAVDGTELRLAAQTLCLHSDSPNALVLAREAAATLRERRGCGEVRAISPASRIALPLAVRINSTLLSEWIFLALPNFSVSFHS